MQFCCLHSSTSNKGTAWPPHIRAAKHFQRSLWAQNVLCHEGRCTIVHASARAISFSNTIPHDLGTDTTNTRSCPTKMHARN